MSARVPKVALFALALAFASAACVTEVQAPLARATQASDFSTYRLRRVGLLPFQGSELSHEHADLLQEAFQAELAHDAPCEIVALSTRDLAELDASDPYRRGVYSPSTILGLARRYALDGLFVGTVTNVEPLPPQALGVQLDLVAAETGLVIWSASVQLDGSTESVRESLERFESEQSGEERASEGARLTLLSPSRFARFAAHEIARTL